MHASVIISTYNRPDALVCVLESLQYQNNHSFEVVVADDGSAEETRAVIDEFRKRSKYALKHTWQQDNGFRLAQIRNKAVAESNGEYLIFLDGDCVVPVNFISNHLVLAESGYFVRGSRVMLSEAYTNEYIEGKYSYTDVIKSNVVKLRLQDKLNRITPLVNLRLGLIRKMKKNKWYGAKGCNIAIWRSDYFAVNGFDERYVGWGREDSDIVIRLIRNKVFRKEGIHAVTVLHLWHPESDRTQLSDNDEKIIALKDSENIVAEIGVSKYANN